jgi:two-component system, cell cycle sensor histidine kinase and response regulator CckA
MKDQGKDSEDKFSELRRQAELAAEKSLGVSDVSALSREKVQQLIHELQVHQIELEMQNEDLRQAQIKLEESRDRHADLYDFAPVGYLTLNDKGFILEANLRAAQLLGIDRQDLVKKPFSGFLCKEHADVWYLHLQEVFQSRSQLVIETRLVRKDGSLFHAQLESIAVKDREEQLSQFRTVISDITERKKGEDALRESEALYRDLVENIEDLVCKHDLQGNLIFVNSSSANLLGYGSAELVGTNLRSYLAPEVRDQFAAYLATVQRDGSASGFMLIQTKTGEKRIWEYSNTLGKESVPAPIVLGIARDVTDRKRAEHDLRESEKKYKELVDNANSVIIRWKRDGTLTFFNEYAQAFFGYRADEVLGKNVGILVPERDFAGGDLSTLLQNIVNHPQRYVNNINENICRDGRRVWMAWTNKPILDDEREVAEILAVGSDITLQKRAEEAARASESFLNSVIDQSPYPMWISDHRGTLIRANNALRDLLQISDEEVVGTYNILKDNIVEEQGFLPLVRSVFEKGDTVRFEIKYDSSQLKHILVRHPTFLILDVTIFPITDSRGTLTNAVIQHMDITERKKAEESLRNLLDFRQTLIDSIPNPVFYKDLESKYIGCNEAFAALVGLPKEEVVGKSVQEVVPKEVGDIWREKDLELFDRPHVQVFEFTMLRPDGTEHTLVNHKAPFFGPDGTLAGLIGVMVDITDRLRAEEAVRQSEEWYRALVENSFDGIFIQKGPKIIFANSHLYDMLGYSQGELEGLDHWLIYHPKYQEITRERAMARMRGEDIEPQHGMKMQRRDGSTFDAEISARAVKVKGEPGVQVWVRDVSKRKRSEEAQQRLAIAVEQSAEAIVITNAQGTIQYVNPAVEQISGYKREEVLGKTTSVFKSGEHDQAFYKNLWETIKQGEVWTGRFINKRKDGTLYHEAATISPVLDSGGEIMNFVAVKRDITEQLELSRQLLQAQKMEAVGTLAGGIAHDFNNLLQVVLGYSELVLADSDLPDRYRDDLGKILLAGRNGADLVQRLLTFSRKTETKPLDLDLNQRIRQTQQFLQRTIPKMIDIELILAGDLARIHADPTQMDQVLMNLAVNARDAMPEGGKLVIETASVVIDEDYARSHLEAEPGSYVLLRVSDTGSGMDKDTLNHIFEPFFTTKGPGEGTGLGLAMVFGIVKQHHGFINCYSEIGHGTTFKVYLPDVSPATQSDLPVVTAMPQGGTETILLVDDEELIRDLGKRMLRKAGYGVLTASNGKEALEVYRKEQSRIALVILDLIMPEMGGKECLEGLLEIDPAIKVLVATGYSANRPTKSDLSSGAKGFVAKPFAMRQVLEMVRKTIDQQ